MSVLKYFIIILVSFLKTELAAQSPYLSLTAKMADDETAFRKYRIELKMCSIKNKKGFSRVFSGDTSKIDFTKLERNDFSCTGFFKEDRSTDDVLNTFSYGNQFYTYETVLILRFTDMSSRGWHAPMFIVIPVRYESFVTFIELNDIFFKSGKIIYLESLRDTRNKDKHLLIKESLKNYSAISYDELPIK